MRNWSYGINSLYRTASIWLEEGPWWVFLLDRIVEFLCEIAPPIRFPSIKLRLKNKEDIEFYGSEHTTWRDWYGDFNQFFHLAIHEPVFRFCQKRINTKCIEIDYNKAKELFYLEDKGFWDKEEKIAKEIIEEEKNKEVTVADLVEKAIEEWIDRIEIIEKLAK